MKQLWTVQATIHLETEQEVTAEFVSELTEQALTMGTSFMGATFVNCYIEDRPVLE